MLALNFGMNRFYLPQRSILQLDMANLLVCPKSSFGSDRVQVQPMNRAKELYD